MNNCKICNSILYNKILTLDKVPSAAQKFLNIEDLESDIPEKLEVYQCDYCKLLQLNCEPVEYYKNVIRSTSFSEDMKNFRNVFFKEFVKKYNLYDKKIIEIGCGKGEYLEMFEVATNMRIFGIENSKESVEVALGKNLTVFNGFIEDSKYEIPNKPYEAFFILNFLEHIPNPKEFLHGIYNNLTDDAVGLVEVPNSDVVISKGLYSEFIKDHVSYFTKDTLKILLELSGFEVLNSDIIWNNDIISVEVRKKKNNNLDLFKKNYNSTYDIFNEYTSERIKKGKIAIWGAGHQAITNISLLNQEEKISYIIDSATFKQGKYAPAIHLPVISPNIINTDKEIKTIIIMADGYSNEILRTIKNNYDISQIEVSIFKKNNIEIVNMVD